MKRYVPLLAIGLVFAVIIALVVRQSPSESTRGSHVEEESDALGPVPTAMGPGSEGILPGSAGTKPTFTTSTAPVPHEKLDAQTLSRVKELETMELEKRRRDQAAAKTHEARVELAAYKSDAWKKVKLTNREKFEALRKAAALSPDKMVPCTICDGKGVLDLCVICDHTGKCPTCHGTGKVLDEICPTCQGNGKCFLCFGSGKMPCPFCQALRRKEVITPVTPDPPEEIPLE